MDSLLLSFLVLISSASLSVLFIPLSLLISLVLVLSAASDPRSKFVQPISHVIAYDNSSLRGIVGDLELVVHLGSPSMHIDASILGLLLKVLCWTLLRKVLSLGKR